VQAQGGYCILGYRTSKFNSPVTSDYIETYFNNVNWDWVPEEVTRVTANNNSFVFGFGYQWVNLKKTYFNNIKPISILYIKSYSDNFDYIANKTNWSGHTYDYNDSHEIRYLNLGGGYGFKLSNGFSISMNIENYIPLGYKLGTIFTFNFKLGYGKKISTRSPRLHPVTSLGHLGLYGTHYPNNHFIYKSGPSLVSNEITVEIPIYAAAIAVFMGGLGAAAVTGQIDASGGRGCHVYGKVKFVEYGENYKIKFVSFGEDLNIKYVNYGAGSSGEWQVVEFGEDYKIKIVEFGEDFKVKVVSFGEGCN